jgi:DNA-binding NarL/FixJ family response regulator
MSGRAQTITRKRIVIADDEAVIRLGVRCIMEDAGHTVVAEASSGAEVLHLIPTVSPDLASSTSECRSQTASRSPAG